VETAQLKPPHEVRPLSLSAPSDWTPSGLTARKVAWRPSLKVERKNCTWSSLPIRSRSASVARTAPTASHARTPRWSAVGEYQTSTSVESVAATRSTGLYCEKPVRIAARLQAGSSSAPSTTIVASMRGGRTERSPRRP